MRQLARVKTLRESSLPILALGAFVLSVYWASALAPSLGLCAAEDKDKKPTAKKVDKKDVDKKEGGKDEKKKDDAKGDKKTAKSVKKKGAGKADAKDEASKKTRYDLLTWGAIKEVKGTDFWSFTYLKIEGRKAKSNNVFLKVSPDAKFYQDKMIQITDLKEGDKVWLFGRAVERETQSPTGFLDTDRQIQNVSAIVTGDMLNVNTAYKDPTDAKMMWLEAEVTKTGQSISVSYSSNTYRVTMARQTPMLRRQEGGEAKMLKNGVNIAIGCDKSEEKPERKCAAGAKKDSYLGKLVVILDPRLTKTIIYRMLME